MIDINELRQSLGAVTPEEIAELLDRLEAWENVFGHLGTPDEVGNEWHSLNDRLEAAEKEVEALREGLKRMCMDEDAEAKEARRLKARIEQMEKQEPVKHEFQGRDGTWHSFLDQRHYENTVADGRWPVRALYALPGANGE